jgi:hypothetical protein
LASDELLLDELTAIRYHDTSVGRVALEPKEELTARLNRSCDRADALSMSLARRSRRGSGADLPDVGGVVPGARRVVIHN